MVAVKAVTLIAIAVEVTLSTPIASRIASTGVTRGYPIGSFKGWCSPVTVRPHIARTGAGRNRDRRDKGTMDRNTQVHGHPKMYSGEHCTARHQQHRHQFRFHFSQPPDGLKKCRWRAN